MSWPSPPSPPSTPYLSAHGRARVTRMLLIAGAIIAGVSMLIAPLELVFPLPTEDDAADNPQGLVFALVQLGIGLLHIFVYIATVVVFLMWLYRAHSNLPAFGTPRHSLSYSSGWAVGSFFVPFVNLVVPYRAVKELWQKSEPFTTSMNADPPFWFALWWLFWIVSNIADRIYFRMSFREGVSIDSLVITSVIADALNVISAIFAIIVVSDIDRRQTEASKSLALELPPVPPPPPRSFDPNPQPLGITSN